LGNVVVLGFDDIIIIATSLQTFILQNVMPIHEE
jgi:hypothetical protein